jgi:hypothetical protein
MAKIFNFYGKEIFDPGVYSKILTVGGANPTPNGENALVIIAEAINGPKFGETVAVSNVGEAQMIFGDQGPAIEAVFRAFNASPSLSPAQDVRVFNPRALVQATGTIETTDGGDAAITLGSRIYGPAGNGIKVSLASSLCTVHFPWSDDDLTKTIDNPIMDIIMPSGFVTITKTTISVGLTAALVDYDFADYPKLIDLINAIEADEPTVSITKDVTTSDNQSTIGLFDQLAGENAITGGLTLKGDLKELFDFLNAEVYDLEATLEATATTAVEDFEFYLTGGTSGVDPDATQWGKVYDELETQRLAVTCPIADGIPAPYDATLTAAIMVLDEQHAVKMNQPDKRGKRRQSFISAHGGYGWAGEFVAKPANAEAIVTIANTHNSEYSQFFGDGLNVINQQGVEYAELPCYFAVAAASVFLGGLASRVLTSQPITAIKASTRYTAADRKKLHQASVIFAITTTTTNIRQFFTTWKSTDEPMKTVPSRVRCALLSDNDIARKLEQWMGQFQNSGFSPQNSEGTTYIRRVLESHQNKSVNWVDTFGEIEFSSSGIEFTYRVKDIVVPRIPEYGFGTTEFLNV